MNLKSHEKFAIQRRQGRAVITRSFVKSGRLRAVELRSSAGVGISEIGHLRFSLSIQILNQARLNEQILPKSLKFYKIQFHSREAHFWLISEKISKSGASEPNETTHYEPLK